MKKIRLFSINYKKTYTTAGRDCDLNGVPASLAHVLKNDMFYTYVTKRVFLKNLFLP